MNITDLKWLDFAKLNVTKRDPQEIGYTEFDKMRDIMKLLGTKLQSEIPNCKNSYSFKLNHSPTQSYWQEGCLRLYFVRKEINKAQYAVQVNIEAWNDKSFNIFLRDQLSRTDPVFRAFLKSNKSSLYNNWSQVVAKGFVTFENKRDYLDYISEHLPWVGRKFTAETLPDWNIIVKTVEELLEIERWYNKDFIVCERMKVMEKYKEIIERQLQIILCGPPGTGKTYTAKKIVKHILETDNLEEVSFSNAEKGNDKGAYALVQFHPSYSYEDFIQGIVATTNDKNEIEYAVKDKILLAMVKAAKDNQGKKFILIIDETNRANLPAVLGELIYSLEYRNEKVDLLYGKYTEGHSDDSFSKTVSLPDNLYIIGTMNTADRSIGHIDYAIRRRFIFIPLKSLDKQDPLIHVLASKWYEEVYKLFNGDNISPEFDPDDVRIGHSYFMLDETEDKDKAGEILAGKFAFQVLPLLKEYYKDGIFKNNNDIKLNIAGYKEIDIQESISYQDIYNDLSKYLEEEGNKEPSLNSPTEDQSENAENNGSDTVDE